jgi:hypothetical protein
MRKKGNMEEINRRKEKIQKEKEKREKKTII